MQVLGSAFTNTCTQTRGVKSETIRSFIHSKQLSSTPCSCMHAFPFGYSIAQTVQRGGAKVSSAGGAPPRRTGDHCPRHTDLREAPAGPALVSAGACHVAAGRVPHRRSARAWMYYSHSLRPGTERPFSSEMAISSHEFPCTRVPLWHQAIEIQISAICSYSFSFNDLKRLIFVHGGNTFL